MAGRRAKLELSYNGTDITEDLLPHLKGWTYTDNLSGQADDLQITLEDRDQLWIGDWFPETGATLSAKVVQENWNETGESQQLDLGSFELDQIETSMPPSVVTIGALSVPESSSLRGERKNRAWEKTKLSVVAGDVANKAGMKLFMDSDNPDYDRVDQAGETDLEFLMRLCEDAGLCLKVADSQVIIFDEAKYEAADSAFTVIRGETDLVSYSCRSTLTGTYRSCRVEYSNPTKGVTIKYEFKPQNAPNSGRVLIVRERVASTKEAEQLAKKRLRQANKNAITFSLSVPGDYRFAAGLTVDLSGFGWFDGKYIITQAVHSQQGLYVTRVELRKVLEGY